MHITSIYYFFLNVISFILFITLESITSLTAGYMYFGLWLPVNDHSVIKSFKDTNESSACEQGSASSKFMTLLFFIDTFCLVFVAYLFLPLCSKGKIMGTQRVLRGRYASIELAPNMTVLFFLFIFLFVFFFFAPNLLLL